MHGSFLYHGAPCAPSRFAGAGLRVGLPRAATPSPLLWPRARRAWESRSLSYGSPTRVPPVWNPPSSGGFSAFAPTAFSLSQGQSGYLHWGLCKGRVLVWCASLATRLGSPSNLDSPVFWVYQHGGSSALLRLVGPGFVVRGAVLGPPRHLLALPPSEGS